MERKGSKRRGEQRMEVNDLRRMRAINHPARWRVLHELWRGRQLTATEAADLVGLTPSAMSYHLNQLARLGLVERVTSPDGRERPWRAIGDGVTMTTQPDPALGGTMMQNLLASISRLVNSAPPSPPDDRPWPAAFGHTTLHLTRAQARQLHERLNEVIAEFDAEASAAGGATDDPRYDYDLFWINGVAGGPGSDDEPRH